MAPGLLLEQSYPAWLKEIAVDGAVLCSQALTFNITTLLLACTMNNQLFKDASVSYATLAIEPRVTQ